MKSSAHNTCGAIAAVMIFGLCLLLVPERCQAMQGKIILNCGETMVGDIQKEDDGSAWIAMKNGSIKFEKSEIKRIVIYSTRDRVREKFISSFKITPGSKTTASRSVVTPYDTIIAAEARRNDLDPALVKAVIKAESNFNPRDTSYKGACGLMQLMPETARGLGIREIYDPKENIKGGTRFLRDMLYQFDGDLDMALAAYNAGPGAVRKYQRIPPYKETRNYVNVVNRYYRKYRNPKRILSYTDNSGCLNLYNER